MNRKEFLVQLTGYGALGAGLAATSFAPCCAAAQTLSNAQPKPADGTPIDERVKFAQKYIKRFMDNLDAELDEPTRVRLMHANGRACHRSITPPPKFPPLDQFIAGANRWAGKDGPIMRREGDTLYFDYYSNPAGLKVADGWCLCPLVEKGPDGLSGTFCECSVGYVTEMFTIVTDKPVKVELFESLKRGGKGCRFKISLAA